SALARFRACFGEQHLEVAETRLALARLASWSEGSEAAEHFAAALLFLERGTDEGNADEGNAGEGGARAREPLLIECLTLYSGFLQARRRFEEAEAPLARAEELTRELYGDELTSEILRRRAQLAQVRGELESAEELGRRALVFELRRWVTTRPDEALEVERVLDVLERAGASERPYVAAFQLLRRFRGDGSFELAGWMNGLARLLADQERHAEAEALLREALHIRCRAYGADCPVRQRTLFSLGQLLERTERTREAVPLLTESLAIAEKNGDERDAAETRAALLRCTAAGAEERP
ncbi:MAG: tetratricopeptide repeat protein, partial [Planctomycetes bacterium]|nr:tetratricopeptide repeat protein [Planctomycetota bacterium]